MEVEALEAIYMTDFEGEKNLFSPFVIPLLSFMFVYALIQYSPWHNSGKQCIPQKGVNSTNSTPWWARK